jgi:hypothetical protein
MTVLTPKNPVETDGLELSPAVRARIRAELTAGRIVVVPRRAVEVDGRPAVAWWRVDPLTGRTLGIAENGTGGDSVETTLLYIHITVAVVGFLVCVFVLGEGLDNCVVAGAIGLGAYVVLEGEAIGVGIIVLAYVIEFFLAKGFHWWDEMHGVGETHGVEPEGHAPAHGL